MAAQSAPPNPTAESPPNPATEAAPGDGQTMKEAANEVSPKSVFVNSQPIREEQIQNAVKFLSHPKVSGSPVLHRRNFLERKGLTKEEIDEAFRRVPDPSPAYTGVQATSINQGGQLMPSVNAQQQTASPSMQPATSSASGVMATVKRRFHWSHAVLAVGFLAASGAWTVVIFKKSIIPRFKSWVRKVVLDQEDEFSKSITLKPSLAEEAVAAAKAAAAAAADVATASQEMLISKSEEKKCFEEFMNLLDVQLQEMKSMRNAIQKLEGQTRSTGRNPQIEDYMNGSLTRSKSNDIKVETDSRSVRSSSPTPSAEPLHPKSYMEIMAMIQRGERPPNIREVNDLPPNPNQPLSNPSLAPRAKPWEVSQPQNNSSFASRGQIINEVASSMFQDNGVNYQINGNNSSSWWQQKNVRITEIENEDGQKTTSSNGMMPVDQPPQRRWVPPQPPPVALPEAALAIRQPKPSVPRADQLVDTVARPVNETDELERITKIAESGGHVELNGGGGGGSEMSSGEIQEEPVAA